MGWIARWKSVSIIVLYCFTFSVLTSCGGGGGDATSSTQSNSSVSAAKITADTSIPASTTETAPVATITNCSGVANLPAGYNIKYWGTKDSLGNPLSITQSYVWKTSEPTKGIRTFFDANGLPILIRDEVSHSTAEITWNSSSVKVIIKDSTGKTVSNLSLVKEGTAYVVKPSATGKAVSTESTAVGESDRSVAKSVSKLDPETRNMIRAIAAGIVVESGKVALYGIAAGLFAPALLPAAVWVAGVPAVVGVLTYAGFSDAVLDAPENIRSFFSSLKTETTAIIASAKDKISSWGSAYSTEITDIDVDTTTTVPATTPPGTTTSPTSTTTTTTTTSPTSPSSPTDPTSPATTTTPTTTTTPAAPPSPTVTCTGGQIQVGSSCQCPAGQTLVSGTCQAPTTTSGSRYTVSINVPGLSSDQFDKCSWNPGRYGDCFSMAGSSWQLVDTDNPNLKLYYRSYKWNNTFMKSRWSTHVEIKNASNVDYHFDIIWSTIYAGSPSTLGDHRYWGDQDANSSYEYTLDSNSLSSITIVFD